MLTIVLWLILIYLAAGVLWAGAVALLGASGGEVLSWLGLGKHVLAWPLEALRYWRARG